MRRTLLTLTLLFSLLSITMGREHRLREFVKSNILHLPSDQSTVDIPNLLDGTCSSCKLTMNAVDSLFQSEKVVTKIEKFAIDVCLTFLDYGEEVCNEMVMRMAPIIVEVLANSYLEANYFCVEIMEACNRPTFTKYSSDDYINEMLAQKPDYLQGNDYINKLYGELKSDPNPRKILTGVILSDVHLDYDQELTEASPFGQYGNETSQPTMEACLEFIKEDIRPDFLFWLGDNSKSDTWDNSLEEVVFYTRNLSDSIKHFGLDQIATIYPIEGNHDVFPVNVEDFSQTDLNEAINGFKDTWEDWMSPEEFSVFEQFGYYSKPLVGINGETYENTKVIAMNTMACYFYNWYLIEDRYDPGQQLDFIVKELDQLEKVGGKAILISHVPPSSECVHEWGARFRAITDRYQHVIRFSLYGHRHRVMYSVAKSFDNKNVGLDFLTGSVAMQPEAHPSFTLVEIDAELMIPVNFKVYIMDVEESNVKKSPVFRLQNDHLQMYGLEDVSPDSMYSLSEQILADEETATLYLQNQYRQYGEEHTSCDEVCRRTLFCDTISTEVYQYETCLMMKPDILGGAFFGIIMNLLVTPWYTQDQ